MIYLPNSGLQIANRYAAFRAFLRHFGCLYLSLALPLRAARAAPMLPRLSQTINYVRAHGGVYLIAKRIVPLPTTSRAVAQWHRQRPTAKKTQRETEPSIKLYYRSAKKQLTTFMPLYRHATHTPNSMFRPVNN